MWSEECNLFSLSLYPEDSAMTKRDDTQTKIYSVLIPHHTGENTRGIRPSPSPPPIRPNTTDHGDRETGGIRPSPKPSLGPPTPPPKGSKK